MPFRFRKSFKVGLVGLFAVALFVASIYEIVRGPQQGDASRVPIMMAVAVLAALAMVYARRRL